MSTNNPEASSQTADRWALSRYEAFYNLPQAPGDATEIVEVREVQALQDGLEAWHGTSTFRSRDPNAMPKFTFAGEGRHEITKVRPLTDSSESPGRSYTQQVTFPKQLNEGERSGLFTITRRLVRPFDHIVVKGRTDSRDITPKTPIDDARIVIRFPADHQPEFVWFFDNMPVGMKPGDRHEDDLEEVNQFNQVAHSWGIGRVALQLAHSSGIAYTW